MLLKQKETSHLLEVTDIVELMNPRAQRVHGQMCYGEELGDREEFEKSTLCFPSGEELPRCWTDIHYRDQDIAGRR